MSAGVVLGIIVLVVLLVVLSMLSKLVVRGQPNEMLVISGRQQRDGQGYRTLIGGSTVVWPIIEQVARLTLRNMQVPLEVKAQAGGGTMMPVIVTGVANVKVSSDPAERPNAIERFLGQPTDQLQRVAKETLEGGLRAVIGKMTPEEIVGDREKFVATVMREVADDFRKLGLLIDSVVIQNVHDEEEYLVSIARKARAEVLSSARKAEAERAAEAVVKEAEANASAREAKADRDAQAKLIEATSRQRAEQARLAADKSIAESETALRVRKAQLAREAALAEAEQQKAEAFVEQARLTATEVAKAIADRDVAKAKAEGDAAKTLEEGKARAGAIEQIGQAIQRNPEALKVMLVEMLPSVVQELAKAVQGVNLGHVTVIDSGDGRALAGAALGRARVLSESMAAVESVLGVDLRQLSQGIARNIAGDSQPAKVAEAKPAAEKGVRG
jgi:flotillin